MDFKIFFMAMLLTPLLIVGGFSLADKLFVGIDNTEVRDENDPFFANVLRELPIDTEVEADEDDWEDLRRTNDFIEIELEDETTGYVYASALSSFPSTKAKADAELQTSAGAEGAAAAARGFTREIEAEKEKADPDFKNRVQKIYGLEEFVNEKLREVKEFSEFSQKEKKAFIRRLLNFGQEGGLGS